MPALLTHASERRRGLRRVGGLLVRVPVADVAADGVEARAERRRRAARASAFQSTPTTSIPSASTRSEMERPMPRAAPVTTHELIRPPSEASQAADRRGESRRQGAARRELDRLAGLDSVREAATRDPGLDAEGVRAGERHRLSAAVRLPGDQPAKQLGVEVEPERQPGSRALDLDPARRQLGQVDIVVASRASGPGTSRRSAVPPTRSCPCGHGERWPG